MFIYFDHQIYSNSLPVSKVFIFHDKLFITTPIIAEKEVEDFRTMEIWLELVAFSVYT